MTLAFYKKQTPIWEELSAIGEAAPPGTWDNVPANLSTLIDDAYGGNTVKYDIVVALTDLIMAVSKMPSVMITSDLAIDEIRKLRAENEALKIAHDRYECVRRLSPRSFRRITEMISTYETIPVKTRGEETPDKINPLRPLAELGRWVLDMLKLNDYCEMDGETIKREAHKLGLLDELDALTSKAKALDVDP